MKSQSELNDLKRNWLNDPCWDIEDTEGFEDHYIELKAYRIGVETQAATRSYSRLEYKSRIFGVSLAGAMVIDGLERRIAELEKKVNES